MTGRVSHKKRQYPAKENEKKPSCGTMAQQGNCHLVFILTCSLLEKCTRMAQTQYLVEKGNQVVSIIWLFCF